MKQKIDNQQHVAEESSALIRRKHQETIAELTGHMETVSKAKIKYEKDYKQCLHQNEDLKKENDMLQKAKVIFFYFNLKIKFVYFLKSNFYSLLSH